MVVATWDEMRNANKGQDMGSFPKNIARAAKDVICDVASLYPDWLTDSGTGGLISSPMVRDLCRRNPPPSNGSNDQAFSGGQCAGVAYQALGVVHGTDFSNVAQQSGGTAWSSSVPGPVTRIEFRQTNTPGTNQYSGELWLYGTGGTPVRFAGLGGMKAISGPSGIQIRRVDLGPDTCGNRPAPPVPVPPIGDIMRPVPVPTPTGPLVLPFVVPVGVFIKPTLQVNVGPINVNFDAGGVTFSPTININPVAPRAIEPQPTSPPNPPLPPSRPPTNPDTSNDGSDCPDVDLSGIIERLEKIKKYTRRPKTALNSQSVGGGNSGNYILPERTKFVVVTVTVPPPSRRIQSGGEQGPLVYHQGWCAVGRDRRYTERLPLSYVQNIYPVPVGCDSFSFTLYTGGIASVSALVEADLPECQEYECG